jgi:hypothetical protein
MVLGRASCLLYVRQTFSFIQTCFSFSLKLGAAVLLSALVAAESEQPPHTKLPSWLHSATTPRPLYGTQVFGNHECMYVEVKTVRKGC